MRLQNKLKVKPSHNSIHNTGTVDKIVSCDRGDNSILWEIPGGCIEPVTDAIDEEVGSCYKAL